MMFLFNNTSTISVKLAKGFSLIELMVVMAIMAVVMSLSGGLLQNSINQQERHVELEKVRQLFKQLSYNAYYQGKEYTVRLEESRLLVFTKVNDPLLQSLNSEIPNHSVNQNQDQKADEKQWVSGGLTKLVNEVSFNQLIFVAKNYQITTNAVIHPSKFSVLFGENSRSFQILPMFASNE